ncbi:MAG: metallo-mystery pair system four-Cys motif protein [Colwellia sp.]|nr:metallo-mystery pair system four-Cys motif protein [Colwellia sp.]
MFDIKQVILASYVGLFLLSGCDNDQKPIHLNEVIFHPTFNNQKLTCDSVISHSNNYWHYSQLQFFISIIELQDNTGTWQKASLLTSAYQTKNVALLGEYCQQPKVNDQAISNTNWSLKFDKNTNLNKATHIRFTLGLPFAINHLNPLTQKSPLNIPSMFWVWQQGHKFLRIEMAAHNDNWLFHLGSVGCQALSPLRMPSQECRYPNRYIVELPLSKENANIVFDLANLLNQILITEQNSCQSSPQQDSCQRLFANLRKKNEHSVFQSVKQKQQKERPHD